MAGGGGAPGHPPRWQDVDPAIDDICRVCRGEGSDDHPLFHPCRCSGSIRYVHEDCLLQWLHHSNRHYCELCQHRFTFRPIYAPDTPSRLPPHVLLRGVKQRIVKGFKKIIHALLVGAVWLVLLPNYCARVENLLFREEGYMTAVQRLLWIGFSPNPGLDVGEGIIIMGMTMAILFSFVFLRDEILHNGWNPPWIHLPQAQPAVPVVVPNAQNLHDHAGLPGAEDPVANVNNPAGIAPAGDGNLAVPEGANVDVQPNAPQAPPHAPANGNGEANIDLGAFGEDIALGHIVGLDGTYAFLEYAFWFSVLCGGFVTIFYLLPFTCGRTVVHDLLPGLAALAVKVLNVAPISANLTITHTALHQKMGEFVEACQYKTVIYLYFGYIAFAICFSQTYDLLGKDHFHIIRSVPYLRRWNTPTVKFGVGLFYLATKTGVLFFTEAVVFPAVFGGLADWSCMDMFNATLGDRLRSFESAPGTFVFLHWILGVLFISYFVWFVLLTRETLRPGLLWFVRSYQESNPFKELVMWPIGKSLRNLTFVLLLFIVVIAVTIYFPVKVLCRNFKSVFPYNLTLLEESPIGELTIQFAVLHYIGPSLFQQTTLRSFAKWIILAWADIVGDLLDIRSYLLGDQSLLQNNNNVVNVNNDGDLGLAHDQLDMMLVNAPTQPVQSYHRPRLFVGRLVLLLSLLAATGMVVSAVLMTVPVLIGRLVLGFWFGARPVHDIYTLFTGLFTLAVSLKGGRAVTRVVRRNLRFGVVRWKFWGIVIMKTMVAALMIVLWLPILIGLTFEVTLLKPVALFFDQSSIFQIYRCFVFGALIVKILLTFCIVAVAENNPWRLALEQVYANGFRNMNLTFLWKSFIWPITAPLLFYLAFPYFLARTYNLFTMKHNVPVEEVFSAHMIEALSHIVFLGSVLVVGALLASMGYFKQLHDQIRDELFLVGKRLVNYDHNRTVVVSPAVPEAPLIPPAQLIPA